MVLVARDQWRRERSRERRSDLTAAVVGYLRTGEAMKGEPEKIIGMMTAGR